MHTSSNDSSCLYGLFFIWPILIRKKQEKKRNFFIADCLDEFIWLLFNLYSIYVFADSYLAGKSFAGVSFYSAAAFLSVVVEPDFEEASVFVVPSALVVESAFFALALCSSMGIFFAPLMIGVSGLLKCVKERKSIILFYTILLCIPCGILGVLYLFVK